MSRVITVHSFRRAAGKTSLVANLCFLLANRGRRVAAIESDFRGPSLNLFFSLPDDEICCYLNDYLWGKCDGIEQVMYDVTPRLGIPSPGRLFLVPASSSVSEIMQILRHPYDLEKLDEAIYQVSKIYQLDDLVLDTSAGLDQDNLLSIALSNTLIMLLRPEKHDFQGTAVTVEVVRNLGISRLLLVLNDIPESLNLEKAQRELKEIYRCEIGAFLPHSEALMVLASAKPLTLVTFDDPYVKQLEQLVARLVED